MSPFGVTYKGGDLFKRPTLRSHIKTTALYEVLSAAHWSGLTETDWAALSRDAQARLLAHYRVHHQIQAVIDYDQVQELKRRG